MNNARIVWTNHLGQEQSIGLEHLKAVLVDAAPQRFKVDIQSGEVEPVAQPAEPVASFPAPQHLPTLAEFRRSQDAERFLGDSVNGIGLAAPPTPQPAEPVLPLLVRDIARELGITSVEACKALGDAGLGSYSQGMAVTPAMAQALRAKFGDAAPQPAEPVLRIESKPLPPRVAEILAEHGASLYEPAQPAEPVALPAPEYMGGGFDGQAWHVSVLAKWPAENRRRYTQGLYTANQMLSAIEAARTGGGK